jgi:cytochrome c peroxidase
MRIFCGILLGVAAFAANGPAPLGLDLYMPAPDDNPITPAKVALGRRLFRDRRLSRDGLLSCAVCHDSGRAFANERNVDQRNVPTIVNRAYGVSFFWDGRAASLEEQAVQPLLNPREMGATREAEVELMRNDRGYWRSFQRVFGRDPTFEDIGRAIACYVRTIRSGGSRYDRYENGQRSILSEEERRGLDLFRSKAGCVQCHAGPNLTDESFHNTGVAFRNGRPLDEGRFAVTHDPRDHGRFKTPTLREVARTAPYMHDGSIYTLEDVIDYYDRGGNRNPNLDRAMQPLHLSPEDKRAIIAFLRTLNGWIREGH